MSAATRAPLSPLKAVSVQSKFPRESRRCKSPKSKSKVKTLSICREVDKVVSYSSLHIFKVNTFLYII